MLTQRRLRHLLHYDPETGLFRWASAGGGRKVGAVAGWPQSDGRGYWIVCVDSNHYRAHRLAWFYVHGEWPPETIDHINGIRSDNRIVNLRLASLSQQRQNETVLRRKGVLKGAHWHKFSGKWRARVKVNGRHIELGYFDTQLEAHRAYVAKAQEVFGEYFNDGLGGEV